MGTCLAAGSCIGAEATSFRFAPQKGQNAASAARGFPQEEQNRVSSLVAADFGLSDERLVPQYSQTSAGHFFAMTISFPLTDGPIRRFPWFQNHSHRRRGPGNNRGSSFCSAPPPRDEDPDKTREIQQQQDDVQNPPADRSFSVFHFHESSLFRIQSPVAKPELSIIFLFHTHYILLSRTDARVDKNLSLKNFVSIACFRAVLWYTKRQRRF